MRRHLLYILSLMMLFSVSCGVDSTEQGETSLVTITVGGSEQRTSAEGDISAAAIPSSVSTISFTISASDMDAITRDVSVSGEDEITETFEIPNGNSRHILVEAKDSSGTTIYRGENTVDLDGTDVSVTIVMVSVGLAPSAPSNVSASGGDGQVTVSWDSVSEATGYIIYWATYSGVSKTDYEGTIEGITETTYTHTDLINGTTYYYVVTAENSNGESSESSEVSATPIGSWARSYGGFGSDMYTTIQQTTDGGYVVVGETVSFGAGQSDYWVLKLNIGGHIDWEKTYGGQGDDLAHAVQQTTDGGYVVAGRSGSFDPEGDADIWILKLDGSGDIAWQKSYGAPVLAKRDWAYSIQQTTDGSGDIAWQKRQLAPVMGNWDWAYSIQQTTDGGYIVGGRTYSLGTGNHDFWVLKLKSDGSIEWQKAYDPGIINSTELLGSMKQTLDGGYIVAGVSDFGSDNFDLWVLKLDGNGDITWEKAYGGDKDEWVFYPDSIQETSDGGYIVASETLSFGAGASDFWILKLKSDGTIAWQKTYGGTGEDSPRSVVQTSDGGYIVSGDTDSFDPGDADFWILKLKSDGTIAWQKTYGGSLSESFPTIQQTADGGYIVGGETLSFGAGDSDFWILKLSSDGTVPNLGADTTVTGTDTDVSGVDTSASVIDTSILPADTSATVTDTAAIVEQQAP